MHFSLMRLTALAGLASLAACGGIGGPQPDVSTDQVIATTIGTTTGITDAFAQTNALGVVEGTTNRTVHAFSAGTAARNFGQLPGTQEMVGLAVFGPSTESIVGDIPTSGTVNYRGGVFLDHVTGIGIDDNGVFSAGQVEEVSGSLSVDVDFDNLDFVGTGTDGDSGAPIFAMQGVLSSDGAMSGSATFAGIDAELQGQVFGNSRSSFNSGIVGAFAGSTTDELVIGNFSGLDVEPQ